MKTTSMFLVVLLTTFSGRVFAQDVLGSYVTQTLAHSSNDSVAQSFHFPGGYLSAVRLAIFSNVHHSDHPATLQIVSGDGPYGTDVVYQDDISVPGMNLFHPSQELLALTAPSQYWALLNAITDSMETGALAFDDLASQYEVGVFLTPGHYTVRVILDASMVNQFGARSVTSVINCYTGLIHCSPLNDNPYPFGYHYQGLGMGLTYFGAPLFPDRDMAFEVAYTSSKPTGIAHHQHQGQGPLISEGAIQFREDMVGWSLNIHDSSGRLVLERTITQDVVALPTGLYILTMIGQGKKTTIKVFVP